MVWAAWNFGMALVDYLSVRWVPPVYARSSRFFAEKLRSLWVESYSHDWSCPWALLGKRLLAGVICRPGFHYLALAKPCYEPP
jgi:hypothetical protein